MKYPNRLPPDPTRKCLVSDCKDKHSARGFCNKHYASQYLAKKRSNRNYMPEYRSWRAMKTRCLNPNHLAYEKYAGRGIGICEEWVNDFDQFFADMGNRPEGYSIERIDNSKGYTPENCKWGTAKEQSINRSVTVRYKGKTIEEWAKLLSISYQSMRDSYYYYGKNMSLAIKVRSNKC